ncbi:MAG: sigma 54-interacting transcriptional regulator [Anaeromicrobium sp.]|jgi:transcriptional regulator with PAS, ATPase and Fis domain|uniref:sigma-54-dependent Fis family transcriptional regulator n=1 Tax=Anaeromicrobium sp. TaxID=1929132 RepID=UPI0025CE1BA0|nr:sigma 54-interacting transcriptional regulator [Anaeromicrobium sp.]MCT4593491.1 sigma 54-interacting transcriptional regulator [Anaeromicrobium sp.]
MVELKKIVSSVQSIAQAIASVMKVEVTIVDKNLERIAVTGGKKASFNNRIDVDSVFAYSLRTGESFVVENPKEHEACRRCNDRENCKEYAEVCCPIKIKDEPIGVIGLIALNEEQRNEIIKNKKDLLDFLNKMADLIGTKLIELKKTEKIKLLLKELETVLNSVDKSIVGVDEEGKIIQFNLKATQLFNRHGYELKGINIIDLVETINVNEILRKNQEIKNVPFEYNHKDCSIRGFYSGKLMEVEGSKIGIVFTFSNVCEILEVVNYISNTNIITTFDDIIGNSLVMEKVKKDAKRASFSNSTVLIHGESGTGKELFARAIHFNSNRAKGPFIPINCAAIPEALLESELFGYEEGSFTGGKKGGRAGKFELANKGTIFLDEIGDMPIHLQTKLLRVLQEYTIEKIGANNNISVDVRIIAATNRDLEKKVLEGEFREDLFYRLNVIPIYIPPLRDRKEDLENIIYDLLRRCNKKLNKNILGFNRDAIDIFKKYSWPGNVRELENSIEYAVNMCILNFIGIEDLPMRLKRKENHKGTNERIMPIKDLEKREIKKALKYYKGDKQAVEKAARALGLGRATMYRKIKSYNITVS